MSFKYINPGFNAGSAFANFAEVAETDSRFAAGQVLKYTNSSSFVFPEVGKHIYCSFASSYIKQLRIGFKGENGSSTVETKYYDNAIRINDASGESLVDFGDGYHNLFFEIYSDATNGVF